MNNTAYSKKNIELFYYVSEAFPLIRNLMPNKLTPIAENDAASTAIFPDAT